MTAFVPERVYEVNEKGAVVCEGTLLYADISGFTKISEKLGNLGLQGTEKLTSLLNGYYGRILNIVEENGGKVIKIIGDALLVAFYGKNSQNWRRCAHVIMGTTEGFEKIHTDDEVFELGVKIAAASGRWIEFVAGDERGADIFLSGRLVKKLAGLEENAKRGEILFSEVESAPFFKEHTGLVNLPEHAFYDRHISGLVRAKILGEHRVITPMFLYFGGYDEENPDIDGINTVLSKIFDVVVRYHGRLHIIDNLVLDGSKLLFLFGAPRSFGNDILNAVQALLEISGLKAEYELKGALNTGYGYAGIITGESMHFYTAIGDVVNTSARLAGSAGWGKFVVSFDVYRSTFHRIAFREKDAVIVKGKAGPQRIFEPVRVKKGFEERFPFIGRKSLLNKLERGFWENSAVVVQGEAGSGKTRLLDEFFKARKEMELFTIRFDGTKSAFSGLMDLFMKKAGISEKDSAFIVKTKLHDFLKDIDIYDGELLRREEFIGTYLFNLAYENGIYNTVPPRVRWQNFLDAIKLFLMYFSRQRPVVFWADDFNEAREEEINLLFYVIKTVFVHGYQDKIKFFISRRGVEQLDFPKNIPFKVIEVGPMNYDEVKDFLKVIFNKDADETLFKEIYGKTEGIPFFVEQFALFLLEKKLLDERDGRFFVSDRGKKSIPENMFSVIMGRIDRLEERVREKLRIGSVIGMKFPQLPLYLLTGDKGIERELEVITREHLAFPGEGEFDEIEYIFSHAYLKDVIYRSILLKKKKELHRSVAVIYEKHYKDKIKHLYGVIARHYDLGESYEKAVDFYLLAGKMAKDNYKNSLAIGYFNSALRIIEKHLNGYEEKLVEIYSDLAELHRFLGRLEKTAALYEKALENASRIGKKKQELDIGLRIIETVLYIETDKDLLSEIEDIISVAERMRLDDILAHAYLVKTVFLTYKGEYKKAISYADRAIELYNDLNMPLKLALSYKNKGLAYRESGDIENAIVNYEKAYRIFKDENYIVGIAGMTNNIGTVLFATGQFRDALSNFEEAYRIWKNIGDVENSAGTLINIGACYESLGDKKNALISYEKSLKIFREIGHLHGISVLTLNIGYLEIEKNNFKRALKLLEESISLRERLKNIPGYFQVARKLIGYYSFFGERTKVLEYFNRMKELKTFVDSIELDAILQSVSLILMREGMIHIELENEIKDTQNGFKSTSGNFKGLFAHSLMLFYALKGDINKAEEYYKEGLGIRGVEDEIKWSLKRDRGMIYTMKGERKSAVEHYKTLLLSVQDNLLETIKLRMEIYRLTEDKSCLISLKKDILTVMQGLPEDLKRMFVNKPMIKNILKIKVE